MFSMLRSEGDAGNEGRQKGDGDDSWPMKAEAMNAMTTKINASTQKAMKAMAMKAMKAKANATMEFERQGKC